MELLLITSPLILFGIMLTSILIVSNNKDKQATKKPLIVLNIDKCPVFKNDIYGTNKGINIDSIRTAEAFEELKKYKII